MARSSSILLMAYAIPLLFALTACRAWATPTLTAEAVQTEAGLAEGLQAFHQGAFDQAVQHWQAAAQQYARSAQPLAHSKALTHLAQAYQALGHYRKAHDSLTTAYRLAQQVGDQTQLASVLGSLGNVYIALGPMAQAKQVLEQALRLAKDLGNAALAARIANNLGNYFTTEGYPLPALQAYQDSAQFARQAGLPHLAARAQVNAAMAAIRLSRYQDASTRLQAARQQLQAGAPTHQQAYDFNRIGLAYSDLLARFPQHQDTLLQQAFDAFQHAATAAQRIGDKRALSYTWGYMGHLYEIERRYAEALQLTRRAATAAQQVSAPESLYRWQWQSGRLLQALGQDQAALAAYRNAVDTLQPIRQELSHTYGKPYAPFRTSIGRVYFEFVDLLLQQAAALTEAHRIEPYLHEARETVERFKAAELRDYFQDDCVDTAQRHAKPLDYFVKEAVIVYPIILSNRTELLVSLPSGLRRYTVPISADKLDLVVRRFLYALRQDNPRRYLLHAQRLYDWLITPFAADLAATGIETLVFVPDGVLRLLPMAALHDGNQFLIEKYALATTPGLALTDPKPLQRDHIQALTMGLSESRQGFAALPHVSQELTAIQNLFGGTQLLDQAFRVDHMEQALKTGDFGIVHIASHGQFASDANQSFILTFDDKLTMDQLEALIGRLRYREDPLELLSLSACETAVGDDRAALGLAGIAVKAGARSALATLWRVEDQSTSILITEFYRQLHQPATSRAQALRLAQLSLLRQPHYQSPFFWSPFLIINNWF